MSDEFNKMFFGVFESNGLDYREIETSKSGEGIYSHECPNCKRMFFGFKRRYLCLDCKIKDDNSKVV